MLQKREEVYFISIIHQVHEFIIKLKRNEITSNEKKFETKNKSKKLHFLSHQNQSTMNNVRCNLSYGLYFDESCDSCPIKER